MVATLLLAGGGVATAAWLSTSAGTATARAGQITAPTGVTIGTITCATSGLVITATIPVSWNAVSGAGQYRVDATRPLGLGVPPSKTLTGTSTTLTTTTTLGIDVTVTVAAIAGTWTSASSAGATKAVSCPGAQAPPRSGTTTTTPAPTTTTPPPSTVPSTTTTAPR